MCSFEVADRIGGVFCVGQLRGIEPEAADRIIDGGIVLKLADERLAAEEGLAQADAFLFGEADHFEREGQGPDQFCDLDSGDDAQDAVERSGVRHGVDMGADIQGGAIATPPANIARGIDTDCKTGRAHPVAHIVVHGAHRLGKEGAGDGAWRLGMKREFAAPRDDFVRVAEHYEPR